MKVLHVISTLAPTSGGTTNVVVNLANYQARAGLDVTVCTTDRGNPTSTVIERAIVGTGLDAEVDLKVFSVEWGPLLYSRSMRRWLSNSIRRFDLIHVHGLYQFPPTYAAHSALKAGIAYIRQPHGALDPYLYKRSSRSVLLKRLYERWFEYRSLRNASAIQYATEGERRNAGFLRLDTESFVAPNGIDWAKFEMLPERGAFRDRIGLTDEPLILFLGRLHHVKGLDVLVTAFSRVKERLGCAQLAIVGPDNDGYGKRVREWVRERRLGESVHFVAHLNGNEVIGAYVDADVFVLPSYTENFGVTVVEAMACGVPVVISDRVNICDVIRDATTGYVTGCEPCAVAAATAELLSDRAACQEMGANGRRVARDQFAWSRVVESLTKEYAALIGVNRADPLVRGRYVRNSE